MSDNNFDDIIRGKLDSLGVESLSPSWDLMKSHMEEQSIPVEIESVEQWDDMIKNTIDNYQVPFNPQHQEVFLHQYKSYKTAKRRMLYNYISRAAIFLLLIFSAVHLYDIVTPSSNTNFIALESNKANIENQKWIQSNNLLVSAKSESTSIFTSFDNNISDNNSKTQSSTFLSNEETVLNNSVNILDNNSSNNQFLTVFPIDNQIAYLDHMGEELTLNGSTRVADIEVSKSLSDIKIGAWVSYDNVVNYSDNKDDYNSGIRSTGVTISKKMGNLEIETGVEYARIKFDPSRHNNLYGSKTNLQTLNIENVDLVVSSVPISAKYHIAINDKVSLYSTVSSKYNTILSNKSKKTKSAYNSIRSPLEDISRTPPSLDGILHGGSLKDNSFITASIGVGLEMKFQDNLIAFIEPSYETQIVPSNISFTDNKYEGFGLKLGVKKRI